MTHSRGSTSRQTLKRYSLRSYRRFSIHCGKLKIRRFCTLLCMHMSRNERRGPCMAYISRIRPQSVFFGITYSEMLSKSSVLSRSPAGVSYRTRGPCVAWNSAKNSPKSMTQRRANFLVPLRGRNPAATLFLWGRQGDAALLDFFWTRLVQFPPIVITIFCLASSPLKHVQ